MSIAFERILKIFHEKNITGGVLVTCTTRDEDIAAHWPDFKFSATELVVMCCKVVGSSPTAAKQFF